MDKQQLFENIKKKKSFLCVGLDTDIKKIPEGRRPYLCFQQGYYRCYSSLLYCIQAQPGFL